MCPFFSGVLFELTKKLKYQFVTLSDYFWGDGAYYYNAIGIGVPLARGAAGPIRLNCAFILITVSRNFLSW
jgi:hypothetical protein